MTSQQPAPTNSPLPLGAAGTIGVLIALGVDFYWMFSESGPFRWLAQIQEKLMGGYYPKFTLVLLLGIEIVALVFIKKIIEMITGRKLP